MVKNSKITIKKIDNQGRVLLPVGFRKKIYSGVAYLIEHNDKLEILPADADLTKYFDSVEVDVSNFEDYHELRRELREVYGH